MTQQITYYPYLGSGKIYARVAGAAAGLMDLGNASKLEIVVKDKKVSLQDFSKPGGGTYASVSRIENATLNMTLNDLNKGNIARAIFGTGSDVAGATVVDEVVTAYKGRPGSPSAPTAHCSGGDQFRRPHYLRGQCGLRSARGWHLYFGCRRDHRCGVA
ncbi:hypothetical protein [Candidatus Aalborgicola defluviihabitans]|uniref:phage tail tube protein n=1 Tax=Candidatus Aalborgicola defluviihabitans TaxID=3386187 RepID=UPI001DFA912B|nr:hypothetical protein [Burkholderiales bacterium]